MKRRKHINAKTLLIAGILIAVTSIVALAVVRFLMPDEVAEILANDVIADAFRSEGAVFINASEKSGDYMITLMGIAPVEKLETLNKGEISRTYAVVAISKTDGSVMPEINSNEYSPFYAIPFIRGVKPWQAGVDKIQGNTVVEGTLYILLGCDSLEIFADKGVYLGISDRPFYSHDTYVYDEDTGVFSPNEKYSGVNILFELHLDAAKADPQMAGEILGRNSEANSVNDLDTPSIPTEDSSDNDNGDESNIDGDNQLLRRDLSPEQRIAMFEYYMSIPLEECLLIEDSVKLCPVDAEGYVSYEYNYDDCNTSMKTQYDVLLTQAQQSGEQFVRHGYSENINETILIVFTVNDAGDITFMLYAAPAYKFP